MATYQTIALQVADRPRPQVLKDVAYTLTFGVYFGGTLQTSFSSTTTISIKRPGGAALATPVVDANVTNTSGVLTYALTAGNAAELGANYTADVKYYVSGVEYHGRFLFDVVCSQLTNPVTTADLVKHHPDLADIYFSGDSSTAEVYIEQSFEDVYQYIDSKGRRPFLVMGSDDLRRPIEHLALAKFFLARIKQEDDRWSVYHKFHLSQFEQWISTAQFVYDEDQSGTADGGDAQGAGGEGDRPIMQVSWRI